MSASYELQGTVKEIFDTMTFQSGFTKREFVVETDSENAAYPNPIKMSVTKDRCAMLDNYKVGDRVRASFALDGRSWMDPRSNQLKYFVDVHAFKIEKLDADGSAVEYEGAAPAGNTEPPAPAAEAAAIADDDLPF